MKRRNADLEHAAHVTTDSSATRLNMDQVLFRRLNW